MKSYNKTGTAITILLFTGIFTVCSSLSVEAGEGSTSKKSTVEKVLSYDLSNRMAGEKQLAEERSETIRKLIGVVVVKPVDLNEIRWKDLKDYGDKIALSIRNPSDGFNKNSKMHFAVKALGKIRASEAVQPLMNRITLVFSPTVIGTSAPKERTTVVEVLIKIGKPSSKEALKRLGSCKKTLVRKRLLQVFAGAEGKDIALIILEQAISKSKSADEKKLLREAATLLKTQDNGDHKKPK